MECRPSLLVCQAVLSLLLIFSLIKTSLVLYINLAFYLSCSQHLFSSITARNRVGFLSVARMRPLVYFHINRYLLGFGHWIFYH